MNDQKAIEAYNNDNANTIAWDELPGFKKRLWLDTWHEQNPEDNTGQDDKNVQPGISKTIDAVFSKQHDDLKNTMNEVSTFISNVQAAGKEVADNLQKNMGEATIEMTQALKVACDQHLEAIDYKTETMLKQIGTAKEEARKEITELVKTLKSDFGAYVLELSTSTRLELENLIPKKKGK